MGKLAGIPDILKRYWGYDRFLPLQPEAMECVMTGRDSLVVLPTGGGKSLCFQAPALALPGMAVVISPLISLMKDQVDALEANGVAAACVHSGMTQSQRFAVDHRVRAGALKLLYVSPERVVMPVFIDYLRQAKPSFFVIDEAHCISHWGHDFRPDYRQLSHLRETFPDLALHAYTATATEHVRSDIVSELRLREPNVLVGLFDRPNLVYRVVRRTNGLEQIREIIDRHPGESGIIYCIRRADVNVLCAQLAEHGYRALPYHAGMNDADRKANQEAFSREKVEIIVATVAFGMGIDKSNVRYVAHMGMPKSIEHYQQESGRAGRDGLEADCCLFYSGGDYGVWKGMLEKSEDDEVRSIVLSKLNAVYSYCTGIMCRHKALVSYFGQAYSQGVCKACDFCLDNFEAMPGSDRIAKAILSAVSELGDIAGPTYTTLVLSGSKDERVVSKGHDRLDSYGALSSHPARLVRDWIEQLVAQEYLEKTGEYNILRLTGLARSRTSTGMIPRLAKPADERPRPARRPSRERARTTGPDLPFDKELFDALRKVRRRKAEELNVPPFIVFGDATLREMARHKPTTVPGFLALHGVGQAKCEAFANDFLAAIRDYGESSGIETKAFDEDGQDFRSAKTTCHAASRGDSQRRADELFAQGHSIIEVAELMQRRTSTVEGYLVQYIQTHQITDPTPWVHPTLVEQVNEASTKVDGDRFKSIFDLLNGEISYTDIRICLTCQRNRASGTRARNDA